MERRKIKNALISVYHKTGLDDVLKVLHDLGVTVYSTGGTERYIQEQGFQVQKVEDLTSYPSILSGRVKTLHPKVFGGILARREEEHLQELAQYQIPEFDLVIVDLYPFEQTVINTDEESEIIEKIDIGGISLIRAAAKNYRDVLVVSSRDQYAGLVSLLRDFDGATTPAERKQYALQAFKVSSHYDTAIYSYFNQEGADDALKISMPESTVLRYGENPHQQGRYYGDFAQMFEILGGKPLSYNNLVDVDAAVAIIREFVDEEPTFAVLKHTNACGVATRATILEAWNDALAGDPVSAFGGVLICNAMIDLETAQQIDSIFYEVLIAPDFAKDALRHLQKKKKRILLRAKHFEAQQRQFKSILNGIIEQDCDLITETASELSPVTEVKPTEDQIQDLLFANKCAKHLKSNTIVLAKNRQLLSMGCGQTSRVDALKQAIVKAKAFGFDLDGAVLASDAFFPFPDCVEIGAEAGVKAVIQPGGSIRDQDSIDMANKHGLCMVTTGRRHFKH
ncbi:MAG: bifunctional phosphoribosylaminoimidazolecarboxamide formyltransferase/IMP cyclohydrolase [Saprospiraceae bacterium]|nr:bifunctional phosphoribosylaminoimidazolecarboxamide formyltransferase/IMP cyclohydrolase [Saprospiraceae bacterium]